MYSAIFFKEMMWKVLKVVKLFLVWFLEPIFFSLVVVFQGLSKEKKMWKCVWIEGKRLSKLHFLIFFRHDIFFDAFWSLLNMAECGFSDRSGLQGSPRLLARNLSMIGKDYVIKRPMLRT